MEPTERETVQHNTDEHNAAETYTDDEAPYVFWHVNPDGSRVLLSEWLAEQQRVQQAAHDEMAAMSQTPAKQIQNWYPTGAASQGNADEPEFQPITPAPDAGPSKPDTMKPTPGKLVKVKVNTIKDVSLTVDEELYGRPVTRWPGVLIDDHQQWRWLNHGGNEASDGVLVNMATGEQRRLLYEDGTFYLGFIDTASNRRAE